MHTIVRACRARAGGFAPLPRVALVLGLALATAAPPAYADILQVYAKLENLRTGDMSDLDCTLMLDYHDPSHPSRSDPASIIVTASSNCARSTVLPTWSCANAMVEVYDVHLGAHRATEHRRACMAGPVVGIASDPEWCTSCAGRRWRGHGTFKIRVPSGYVVRELSPGCKMSFDGVDYNLLCDVFTPEHRY